MLAVADRPQARPAGQVDRVPQRGQHGRAPRPRPDPGHRGSRPTRDGTDPRARRWTCWPTWAPTCSWSRRASRCSARSCTTAIYKMDAYRFGCTGVFTTKTPTDAYRGAGRPGGHLRHRADHGRARRRAGHGPAGAAASRTGSSTRSSRTPPIAGLTYDSRQLRGGHGQGDGAVRLRRAARRAGSSGGPASDPVQLGIGISTFTEMCGLAPSRVLGALAYGAGGWEHGVDPDAAHRQGRGGHRHQRRTARATRRRGARSSPTSSACRSRTSRCCTATPRSRPKGMDTYGSRSLAVGGMAVVTAAREGGREGQGDRRAPARGQPRTTWSSPAARSRSGATRTRR